jgi:hypothetical protein
VSMDKWNMSGLIRDEGGKRRWHLSLRRNCSYVSTAMRTFTVSIQRGYFRGSEHRSCQGCRFCVRLSCRDRCDDKKSHLELQNAKIVWPTVMEWEPISTTLCVGNECKVMEIVRYVFHCSCTLSSESVDWNHMQFCIVSPIQTLDH